MSAVVTATSAVATAVQKVETSTATGVAKSQPPEIHYWYNKGTNDKPNVHYRGVPNVSFKQAFKQYIGCRILRAKGNKITTVTFERPDKTTFEHKFKFSLDLKQHDDVDARPQTELGDSIGVWISGYTVRGVAISTWLNHNSVANVDDRKYSDMIRFNELAYGFILSKEPDSQTIYPRQLWLNHESLRKVVKMAKNANKCDFATQVSASAAVAASATTTTATTSSSTTVADVKTAANAGVSAGTNGEEFDLSDIEDESEPRDPYFNNDSEDDFHIDETNPVSDDDSSADDDDEKVTKVDNDAAITDDGDTNDTNDASSAKELVGKKRNNKTKLDSHRASKKPK